MKRTYLKHTLVIFMLMITFGLAACDGGGKTTTTNGGTNPTTTQVTSGDDSGTTTTTGNVVTKPVPNMMGQDFVIMVNKASTTDPRSESYLGNWKQEKIARIEYVEEKYNINVVYKTYPADAVFGGGRENTCAICL